MKQAVIQTGGKQYIVSDGDVLDVERIEGKKKLEFEPLMVFDDKSATVGTPVVKGKKVTAEVVEPTVKGEKVTVFKYKAKKRISKKTGHRQQYTRIKVTGIK